MDNLSPDELKKLAEQVIKSRERNRRNYYKNRDEVLQKKKEEYEKRKGGEIKKRGRPRKYPLPEGINID